MVTGVGGEGFLFGVLRISCFQFGGGLSLFSTFPCCLRTLRLEDDFDCSGELLVD